MRKGEVVTGTDPTAQQRARGIPAASRDATTWSLIVAGLIATLHALGTWGHVTAFWGDYGYMMDLIARAHAGLVPYRDFHWGYPPLAIWLYGAATRITGIDLAGIWTLSLLVYGAVTAAFVWYVRLVLPSGAQPLVSGVALLLAVSIANLGAAPLPLGGYSPAGPLGFLLLLVAWCAVLQLRTRPSLHLAVVASLGAGLAVLTKHDYWVPSAYTLLVAGWTLLRSADVGRKGAVAAVFVPAGLTVGAGATWIVYRTDVAMLLDIVRGFGLVAQQSNRGSPTLEILTIEITVIASLVALLSAVARPQQASGPGGGRLTWIAAAIALAGLATWVFQTFRIAQAGAFASLAAEPAQVQSALTAVEPGARAYLRMLYESALAAGFRRPLPTLLLFAVAAWLFTRSAARLTQRRTWLVLLGFAITLRLRRQFEYVEWFSILVEFPIYVGVLMDWADAAHIRRRLVASLTAVYAMVGLLAYHNLARGAFTQRADHAIVRTPRGAYRAPPGTAELYRSLSTALNDLDPTGTRPVFGYGYTNGYNYFTGRSYPVATPIGFRATARARPESTVRAVLSSHPAAIVVDNPFYDLARMPKPGWHLHRWALPFERPRHNIEMRAAFNSILERCAPFRRLGNGPRAFAIYDCARPRHSHAHGTTR